MCSWGKGPSGNEILWDNKGSEKCFSYTGNGFQPSWI